MIIQNSLRYTPYPEQVLGTRDFSEVPDSAFWITKEGLYKEYNKENVVNDNNELRVINGKPLLNFSEFLKAQKLIQNGDNYTGLQGIHPEIYPVIKEIYSAIKTGGRKAGLLKFGAIDGSDFQNIKATLLSSKLLGIVPLQHILLQMVSQETTNRLDFKVRKWFEPDNQIVESTGFYNIQGSTVKGKFEDATATVEPMGYKFDVTEDFYFEPYYEDIIGLHTTALQRRLDIVMNLKVATAINALTTADSLSADFEAFTGEHHTTNAVKEIKTRHRTIVKRERSNPNSILSNVETYDRFISNDSMRNEMAQNIKTDVTGNSVNGMVSGLSRLPGIKWGWDTLLDTADDGRILIYDPEWFMFISGPRRLSTVVNNLTRIQQTMLKVWNIFRIFDFGVPQDIRALFDSA